MNGTANFNNYDNTKNPGATEVPSASTVTVLGIDQPDHIVNDRHAKVVAKVEAGIVSGKKSAFNPGQAKHCAVCTKSVTLSEERLACNQVWHVDCFRCGGKQSDGCKKKLTLDAYTSHAEDPYCKQCYDKLFGRKIFVNARAEPAAARVPVKEPAISSPVTPRSLAAASPVYSPGGERIVNDRNAPAIDGEVMPAGGSVQAALAKLKQALPKNN